MKNLIVLFIGDIFGELGVNLVFDKLPKLIKEHRINFVIANAENATKGRALSSDDYHTLSEAGINVFTMGNHTFFLSETQKMLETKLNILRPNNYSKLSPGRGSFVFKVNNHSIRVTNLLGQTFMPQNVDNPLLNLEEIVKNDNSDFHFVDFHAESTAEKMIMGWSLDGQINALVGTHTHVPTADARILPKGTFFISDLGMTGPYDSIIGAKPEPIINAKRTNLPFRMIPAKGRGQLCALLLTLDTKTKKVKKFKQIIEIFD